MRRISWRKVVAIGGAVAACMGVSASMAQATGPGTGQGLVLMGTFPCTNLATGVQYSMTFKVPGAQNGPGPGARNAPFPGFLMTTPGSVSHRSCRDRQSSSGVPRVGLAPAGGRGRQSGTVSVTRMPELRG